MSPNKPPEFLIEEKLEIKIENIYFHKITIYNDSVNDFGHVEDCLMRLCYKTKREAKKIAMEAHDNGKAICFTGSLEECETIAEKMTTERLTVSIQA